MSPKTWTEHVEYILDAIAEIEQFTYGMDAAAFADDAKTIKAVALNFILIGKAAAGIPIEVQQAHPQAPWHLLHIIRDRLIDIHASIDSRLIWELKQHNLQPLVESLKDLLTGTEDH